MLSPDQGGELGEPRLSVAGQGEDREFLESVFQKCLVNFTWWVNREDDEGDNLFAGGFLGLDNIGLFDRSKPLPNGGRLQQADATAWMAFYCTTMLAIALELAREDAAYADIASKFFEHFAAITQAMNDLGGSGLWDERDGFYYDQANVDGHVVPVPVRSAVGLIPLFAAHVIDAADLAGAARALDLRHRRRDVRRQRVRHRLHRDRRAVDRDHNPAGTLHLDSLPTDDPSRAARRHDTVLDEIASERSTGTPRRRVLGHAEPPVHVTPASNSGSSSSRLSTRPSSSDASRRR